MTSPNGAQSGVGPLSHIKVLDLCHARAGPTAVRVLADFGAQVIQVVRPAEGTMDASFPNFDRENLHRNKRSIAIDLQTDAGRRVFYRLVEEADVVVENFRADVKYRLKVDYETLRQINPRIVMGSISGFGQDGPYGKRPGVDQIAQGMGGLMSITGPPGSGPWRVGIPIDDLCAGMFLSQGIMAALLERERSGQGQWVHTSLLEAQIAMLDFQATRWLIAGEVPGQAGNDHPTGFPTGVFPAKDGVVNIGSSGDRMFRDFLRVIGAEELAEDPRFATSAARAKPENRTALREAVDAKMRQMTVNELIEKLNDVGVPAGPIYTIDQTFADPQVQHLQMAQTVVSPVYGPLTIVRSPVRLSRTSTSLRSAAPVPGGDTEQVLVELGLSADEIAELEQSGAIGMKKPAVAG
ncbi:MAG TPA: CaiB/BaiF CoA-transferase family protein [Chloroflexota bacterium]|nr:CaiB/BaiF CoA-transferase family protein [Chloroflexota bacterium]